MSVSGRTLNENLAIRMGGTPATWAAAAVYGNWVQLKGKARRALGIALSGELDGDLAVEVFEATDSSGTGAQELNAAAGVTDGESFANGTDESRVGLIEVLADDLSSGYTHIAFKVTPAATDGFAGVWILSDLYEYPAENTEDDGVAFVAGE